MPDQHGLNTGTHIGIYGKHPAAGDFLTLGLSEVVQNQVERWLSRIMPQVKEILGDNWGQTYDTSPDQMFWIGGSVSVAGPMCGLIRPSRDKVGRRFPLVVVRYGTVLAPPVIIADTTEYTALRSAFDVVGSDDPKTALAEIAAELKPGPIVAGDTTSFWAANPVRDVDRLWPELCQIDQIGACAARSYVWTEKTTTRAACVRGGAGWPDAETLAWLYRGAIASGGPT